MDGTSKATTRVKSLPISSGSIDGIKSAPAYTNINPSPKRRFRILHNWWILGLVVFAVLVLSIGGYLYHKHQESILNGQPELTHVENEISKLYLLPTNEVPALATVTNSSKLTTPFFKQAKDGDKILIYQKNQVAIIYRPSINKIISVGPVDITTPSASN